MIFCRQGTRIASLSIYGSEIVSFVYLVRFGAIHYLFEKWFWLKIFRYYTYVEVVFKKKFDLILLVVRKMLMINDEGDAAQFCSCIEEIIFCKHSN